VAVPKAAVHKYDGFSAGKNNVRLARQIRAVQAKSQALPM
jgi:hypothetical protein